MTFSKNSGFCCISGYFLSFAECDQLSRADSQSSSLALTLPLPLPLFKPVIYAIYLTPQLKALGNCKLDCFNCFFPHFIPPPLLCLIES